MQNTSSELPLAQKLPQVGINKNITIALSRL
jgi:hypothetical protein